MKLNPYLAFAGQAADAMTFYQSVLGGTLTITRYRDLPDTQEILAGTEDLVAHARLELANVTLQASDMTAARDITYSGFDLQIEPDDVETGRALFERLAGGGKVLIPFGKTSWSEGFGSCGDRFGMPWLVNCG